VLTVGSLFSGIGGLDLGLERAGMEVIWQSEIDPFCCKVLKKHWPKVVNHGDIRNIEWQHVERPDVICGGYPCQPFSNAGKRRGENDPRHLWPIMFNAICNLRPRYALMENVRGHLSMGFGTVLGDLAQIGFNAQWQVLPASAFGAPHRRDRVFIVAHAKGGASGVTEPHGLRPRVWETTKLREPHSASGTIGNWWEIEPNVGRVANGVPNRVDRLRGLGNAVVPQIAEFIGRLIIENSK
jgi:DNA (cytosine-5)-methyltransferase 1